jgi:site-specific DNA-cytosine methylase
MKVLIACEESQEICKAFRALYPNDEIYSCDKQQCSGGHPEWHIQCDVIALVPFESHEDYSGWLYEDTWDAIIAHPPCDHIAVSGARWFDEKRADGRQAEAIRFFMIFVNTPVEKVCIENPIGIMSTHYRKPDQIIQPWQFGHGETKATCLWLKGLPKLTPTNIVDGREARIHKMAPGPNRSRDRSRTYPGIAKAIAEQFSAAITNSKS